jgi:predicted O-methyltransferase YrrM
LRAPPLVERASALAAELGFEKSCRPGDGALLHVLAGRRTIARAGEIGTGAGVGAAWIVSALAPGIPFVTVEVDAARAAAAGRLFAGDADVRVLAGDWRELLPPEAPFDFLFVDATDAKDDVDAVLGLLAPSATVVLDDFSADRPRPDERRDAWLDHPRLAAVELGTGGNAQVVVATYR